MKRQQLFLSLMAVLLSLLSVQDMMAKTETRQDALYIFRNDGGFNFFFYGDIDRICYSKIDTAGVEQPDYVVQEVWALDTVCRIPLTAIDSVAFITPENIVWPDVFCPDDRIADYIIDGDSIWWIRLAHDTPAELLPTVGGKMLIDADVSPFIPDGFGGRVAVVEHEEDGWLIATEPTDITEIYQRLVLKGAASTANEPDRAPKRGFGYDGTYYTDVPTTTILFPSVDQTYTLTHSVVNLEGDNWSVAGNLTGTYHPKYSADLTYRGCVCLDMVEQKFTSTASVYLHHNTEIEFSLSGELATRIELPFGKKVEKNVSGLKFEIGTGLYLEGNFGGYEAKATIKREEKYGAYASLKCDNFLGIAVMSADSASVNNLRPSFDVGRHVNKSSLDWETYLPYDGGSFYLPNSLSIAGGVYAKADSKIAMPIDKARKKLPNFLVKYMLKHEGNEGKDTVGYHFNLGLDIGGKLSMKLPWQSLNEEVALLESGPVYKALEDGSEFKGSLFAKAGVEFKVGRWALARPFEAEVSGDTLGLVPHISGVTVDTDTEQTPIRPYVKRFISPIKRNVRWPVDIGFVVFDEDKEIVAKQCDLSWYSEDVFGQNLPYFKDGTYQFTMNIDPGRDKPVQYTAYPMVRLANGHELLVYGGDYNFIVDSAAFDISQRVITVGPESGMLNGEYVGSMEVEVIPNMENVEVKTENTWLRNIIWSGHQNELTFFWDDLPDGIRSRRGVIRLMGLSQKGVELVEDSIVVIQSTAYVDVEPKQLTFPKEGGTQTVTITETSLTDITPTIVSDNIHVSMTDNVITVTADANTDEASRYVWIYINGTAPDGRLTSIPSIEVTQEGTGGGEPGSGGLGGISEDLMALLSDNGMNLYYGDNPPIVDGVYAMQPIVEIGLYGGDDAGDDDDDEDEEVLTKYVFNFHDQNGGEILFGGCGYYLDPETGTEYVEIDDDDEEFVSLAIMGHDNKFTAGAAWHHEDDPDIFFDFWSGLGYIVSGEMDSNGIKNMQFGIIFFVEDDDGEQTMFAITGDGDGISYPHEWPGNGSWIQKTDPDKFKDVIASRMKKMAKSLFKQIKKQ